MKRHIALVLLATAAYSPPATAASYSLRDCQAWFQSVDTNRDGSLGRAEKATQFLSRVTLANDEGGDYIMSKAFFMTECRIGSFGKPPA